ncbi:MAG: amidohydrolase family protein [Acidimicrobiia bacterium]
MTKPARSLSIINALVFDGESSDLREHAIHVAEGRIVGLGGKGSNKAELVDARGSLVAPGLIDAHFHAYGVSLDLQELESLPLSYVVSRATTRLRGALQRGFTTVRDVAGGDIGLQRALDEGVIPGPRYLFTGPALSQTGGHSDPRPAHATGSSMSSHVGEIVDGVDPLRRVVRERFRTGAHAVKIMTSGGVISPNDSITGSQYSPAEIAVVTEEARRHGSYVAAHAYTSEAITVSVSNGVRTIEHGNLIDENAATLMAEGKAYLVPTLVAYDAMSRRGQELGLAATSQEKNAEIFNAGLRSIEIARAAGVRIGFGTDLMGELEDDQLLEFQIRSQIEPVIDLLRSATTTNASIIGREDLGRIREGAVADLLLFEGNPFQTPSALWSPSRTVIKSGRLVSQ